MAKTGAACALDAHQADLVLNVNQTFSTGELTVEPNRYHLVWGAFCPWATPIKIELSLLGLDDAVTNTNVYPLRKNGRSADWFYNADGSADSILSTIKLSDNYALTQNGYTGKAGVPALIDKRSGKVVNNDSDSLLDEFAQTWQSLVTNAVDLDPQSIRSEVRALDDFILEKVAKLPGQALEATNQADFNVIASTFFKALDELDERLSIQKYLFGEQLTQSDVRLFVTLVRFDVAYYYLNKLNAKRLVDYPNLWRYARELYQLPAFKQNTDFDDIKQHFYVVNETPVTEFERFIPFGIDLEKWES